MVVYWKQPPKGAARQSRTAAGPFGKASGRALECWARRFTAAGSVGQVQLSAGRFPPGAVHSQPGAAWPVLSAGQAVLPCLACACSPPLSGRSPQFPAAAVRWPWPLRPGLVSHFSGGFFGRQGPGNRSPCPPLGGLGKFFCPKFGADFWAIWRIWGDYRGEYSHLVQVRLHARQNPFRREIRVFAGPFCGVFSWGLSAPENDGATTGKRSGQRPPTHGKPRRTTGQRTGQRRARYLTA